MGKFSVLFLSGNTEVAIPALDRKVEYMLISEFDPDTVAVEHSSREVKEEIWGFTDAAGAGDYLAQKFLKDFDENNVWKGEINRLNKDKSALYEELFAIDLFMEDGWKADKRRADRENTCHRCVFFGRGN